MKILLTGGAGFIGSHCADAFLNQGHEVIVVDNLSSGKKENLSHRARFYNIDITDERLKDIIRDQVPDCICHHAAQTSVRISVDDPVKDAQVNIIGGIKLANLAVEFGIKRFIFSSTGGAIYGEQEEFPASESHPLRPISPYGISKLSFEKYLYYYKETFGLEYCILRYSNVYGPRQDPLGESGVVAIFCKQMLDEATPIINGDGKQTRDFIYVGDVAEANVCALSLKGSHCFNIGTGQETTINKIFQLLKELTGQRVIEVHGLHKKGEQTRSVISPQLAYESMGWRPKVSIREGLSHTVEYFRNELDIDNDKSN